MKQLFTRLLLFGVIMLSTLSASAYDARIDGIYYNFDTSNKTASVTRGYGYIDEVITIPATVIYNEETYSVTSIEYQAFYFCFMTSITIPNSVTSIGDYAFCYCMSLTSINIPNSVTSIGKSTFRGCSSLTSITIPNSVTNIGNDAFSSCIYEA